MTGQIKTNAYLLYDVVSGEAALFDVGGSIDSLTSRIDEEGLSLKYIFSTHGHVDHVIGTADIRARYPRAQWGIAPEETEDMERYARWEEVLPPDEVMKMRAAMQENEAVATLLTFDFARLGAPDILLEEGQVYRLGTLPIQTLLSPGHSRGSICFYVQGALFSGDVLFYRQVGGTDLLGSGGQEAIIQSVRRLYESFPDETTVYPGHGRITDIGSEKTRNREVQVDRVGDMN